MKHILVTDTHLGIKKNNDVYIESFNDLIGDVCEYAYKYKIKSLIHLGDFFDTRKSLSLKVIDTAINAMEKLEDVFDLIHLIVGNHDTYYRNQITPTSLSLFEEHDIAKVITQPTMFNDILLVPYLFDPDVLKDNTCNYCMGHFDISGFEMNSSGSISLYTKLKMSDFSGFKKTFSGHYHVPSTQLNIQYLGSPMQFTFNEINQKLGFYVFDDENGKTNFIEFTKYPKHVIIKDTVNINDIDIKGNNIKLIFTRDHGIEKNSEIVNSILTKDPNKLNVDYFNIDTTVDDVDGDVSILSKIDILYDYYNKTNIPEHLNKLALVKLTNKIYKKTIGEC